jgi:hypothetical protein
MSSPLQFTCIRQYGKAGKKHKTGGVERFTFWILEIGFWI